MFRVLPALLLIQAVFADLPVHCLKSQIQGRWKLMLTSPLISGNGPLSCGHDIPDNERTSQNVVFEGFNKELEVILTKKNNVVMNRRKQGTWSMVYDEGFEVDVANYRCFAFSKYKTNYSGAYSYCGETLVGWYHDISTNQRGCYKAVKLGESVSVTDGAQNGHVVQPGFFQFKETKPNKVWTRQDAETFVKQLNQANISWKARVYENLIGLTTFELNMKAGRKRHFQQVLLEKKTHKRKDPLHRFDLSKFPKQLSWEKYLGKIYEQKQCGSCYAISTMSMLSARLRIKGVDVELSPQFSIDCNYYNQGCDGGYPFLVEKFVAESSVLQEHEYPYTGHTGKCRRKHGHTKKYKVSNYRFIGGAYGKSNEENIMEELMKNGPIVMNFEPSFDFMFYVGGVYHTTVPDWLVNGLARPEWEKVDHSVLCYGWGETEAGEKYWLLQNSWGREWGEDGKFRMRRGSDESAIESMAEAADIEVIGG